MHRELRRHVVVGGILHHRRAGDGVRQVADIRAARVTRRQTAHRVGIAIHCEGQRLEARRTLFSTVVGIAGVAAGHHRDLVLLRTVGNGQLTLRLRAQSVVGRHIRAAAHHLEGVGSVCTVGVLAHQRALGRRVGDGSRLAFHHVAERVGRVAVLLGAVVLHGLVGHGDRHLASRNLQRALNLRNVVVASLRAARQRISEGIGAFADRSLSARYIVRSALARYKAVAAHRHRAVGQRSAVVGLAVACGG